MNIFTNTDNNNHGSFNGTINETIKLYNNINFDEVTKHELYDKLDDYKNQIVELLKKVNAYEKIVNEQKNKIRLMETQIIQLDSNVNNLNNIIVIQEDVIKKSRRINDTLYDKLKQK